MLKHRMFASATLILGWIKNQAAAAKAHCDWLEARVSAHRIIVSDVFGADAFVSHNAAAEPPPRAARWDDGLDFDARNVVAITEAGNDDFKAVPAFLTRPRPAVQHSHPVAAVPLVRRHLPTVLCAGILLIAWITAGRSGPISQSAPSSADAIAEQFAGSDSGRATVSHGVLDADARLQFAPRFAVMYAGLLSNEGVCAEGDTLTAMQSAAIIMIRNLPSGTVLSAGEQVTATAWRLKPHEVNAIVVKIPPGHNGPIQAKIERLDESGDIVGQMAIEVRDAANDPQLGAATQRKKTYRAASLKSGTSKRNKDAGGMKQAAEKPASAGGAAKAETESPAKQQFSFQLPFLPGPHSKTPPPGNTVSQQILINLGVISDAPAPVALTQSN